LRVGRPPDHDWLPLGLDQDPIPGDPNRVGDEAQHLSSVASTILDQINALNQISGDDTLVGEYADKIRSTADDIAKTLKTVHDRYQQVSSALSGWQPELTAAQALSITALNQAEGPYKTLGALQGQVLPTGPNLTAQQQQQVQDAKKATGQAQQQLADAQALLQKAIHNRDTAASTAASKINAASSDSLKDSWWDQFKNLIGQWSWLIKDICTVLEIVAAVLAIIALFATGTIWLVLAFALTAAALIMRTLLAATGNGSWLDVVLDAFALLTLGVSGGITGAGGLVGRAGATLGDAIKVGDTIVQEARDASLAGKVMSVFGKASDMLNALSGWFSKFKLLSPLAWAAGRGGDFADVAVNFIDDYQDIVRPMATAMVKGIDQESALARAAAGGEDLGNYVARMKILTEAFSDSPQLMDLASTFNTQVNVARSVIFSSAGINLGTSLGLPGIPVYTPGDWGPAEPSIQVWHTPGFGTADEAMTGAIPLDTIVGGAWHLVGGS
jgi:hypothetical protein